MSAYLPKGLLTVALCFCVVSVGAATLDDTDTATGTGTLANNQSAGVYNTATGYYALNANTTGQLNTATGGYALQYNTTGVRNTAAGINAMTSNTTGSGNTAMGYQTMQSNVTGNYNAAFGGFALFNNSAGKNNVAIGDNALFSIQGSSNIGLGFNAGAWTQSGSSDIYIGHVGIKGDESNVTRIGQVQTKTFIAGIAKTPLSGASVVIKPDGQLGVVMSSARYKKDIEPLADASDKLAQLRPVSFRYKTEPDATHYGLIAEEVDKVMPELVVRDEENRPESVQYQELIPLLLQQSKAQQARLARAETENARAHELIERQAAALKEQEGQLARQEAALAELRRMLATRLAAFDGTQAGRGDK